MKDNPEPSVRQCRVCNEIKPLDQFHRGKQYQHGRSSRCKDCRRQYSSDLYKNNWFKFTCKLKKQYCKKHDIAFNLTPEYLESIYTDSCPALGVTFVKHDKTNHNSPTLDRIDPSKGYVQGNVCYISHRANRIKYDATVQELKQILEWYEGATTKCTPKWVEAAGSLNRDDDIV